MKDKMLLEESCQVLYQPRHGYVEDFNWKKCPSKLVDVKKRPMIQNRLQVRYLNRPKRAKLCESNNPTSIETAPLQNGILFNGVNREEEFKMVNVGFDRPSLSMEMDYSIAQKKAMVKCGCRYRNKLCIKHAEILKYTPPPSPVHLNGGSNKDVSNQILRPVNSASVGKIHKPRLSFQVLPKLSQRRICISSNNFRFSVDKKSFSNCSYMNLKPTMSKQNFSSKTKYPHRLPLKTAMMNHITSRDQKFNVDYRTVGRNSSTLYPKWRYNDRFSPLGHVADLKKKIETKAQNYSKFTSKRMEQKLSRISTPRTKWSSKDKFHHNPHNEICASLGPHRFGKTNFGPRLEKEDRYNRNHFHVSKPNASRMNNHTNAHNMYAQSRIAALHTFMYDKRKKDVSQTSTKIRFLEVHNLCVCKNLPNMSNSFSYQLYRKECAQFWLRNALVFILQHGFLPCPLKKFKLLKNENPYLHLPKAIKESASLWCKSLGSHASVQATVKKGGKFFVANNELPKEAVAYTGFDYFSYLPTSAYKLVKDFRSGKTTGAENTSLLPTGKSRSAITTSPFVVLDCPEEKCSNVLDISEFAKVTARLPEEISLCNTGKEYPISVHGDDICSPNESSFVAKRVSTRLKKKRDSGVQGPYDADYLVEIPVCRKNKRTKLGHPYSNPKFWNFYRDIKSSQMCKMNIRRRQYIKYGQQCNQQTENAHTAYTSENDFDSFITLNPHLFTSNPVNEKYSGVGCTSCHYCGRSFKNLTLSEQMEHSDRHHISLNQDFNFPYLYSKKHTTKLRNASEDSKNNTPPVQADRRATNNLVDSLTVIESFPNRKSLSKPVPHVRNPFKRATARKSNIAW
ncbi:uncharacterized protein LOC143446053 [Clavelina lepadiformis]|uniref:uncharacterized protein LOC143446053 n=1 Tax=Clavelina lepadiformis TaxID=159417 RepID=UPI00404349ED